MEELLLGSMGSDIVALLIVEQQYRYVKSSSHNLNPSQELRVKHGSIQPSVDALAKLQEQTKDLGIL
jgi:hypothetical protein